MVVSPHGMLHPKALQISRLRKQISLFFFEKPLLHYARCVHALNSFESDSISSISVNSNIVVIPNGVSILSPSTIDCRDLFSLPPDSKILLYLGRYHPGKNVVELAQAWKQVSPLIDPSWWLVFVGHGDYSLLEFVDDMDDMRIRRFGPFFGQEKHNILSSVNAFILPSIFEALPMSVLEAMSYSLPCLLTDQCNLSVAFDKNAAFRIDLNSLPYDLLSFFAQSSDSHRYVGSQAFELVSSDFSWDHIADLFLDTYKCVSRQSIDSD